jgi:hypothetical protein
MTIGTILIIILVLVLIGGFGGWVGGPWYGGSPHYVGGGLGLVLVIVLILVLLGHI